jgi:cation-transporting ATPase E
MTSSGGLTAAEVAQRVARGEVNALPRSDLADYADIVVRNVVTLFNGLVVAAAVALLLLGKTKEGLGVSGMALTNMILGLIQEIRAKRHLDRLALLTETTARVLRDGKESTIRASEIVRGDHLLLRAGEPVLADGTLVEAEFLEIDEALLTGESDPVPRRAGERLLSGSFCVAGEGRYTADKVGPESFALQTTREARQYHHALSPLQKAINRILQILTATAIALCLLYGLLWLVSPFDQGHLAEMVAATITSMIPAGLVLMGTLAFVLGAVRMTARGALVQRLDAVESMAAVNILCLDKTGTLTTGNLVVASLNPLAGRPLEDVRSLLRLFADASADGGNKSIQALRAELGPGTSAEVRDRLPFKSQNRYSAVRVEIQGRERVLVLGAAEALGPLCDDGTWQAAWQELLPTGLRLLLFAETSDIPRDTFGGSLEGFRLAPVALVALRDELRPEATSVLQALAEQGIAFKIISGDNPETVRATVAPLNLPGLADEPVTTGAELEAAPMPGELILQRRVFGRVSPRQKLQIVRYLQGLGYRVGMIGDGVNDVLPIKNATLGIAMGEGSTASKTVSGIVLENNDFRLLPRTLEEGRTILRNLRQACKLFLVKNLFTLVLIVGMLALFGPAWFPYRPLQVTLLNALTIGIPALLVIASTTPAKATPRTSLVAEVLHFVLRTGLVVGVAGLVLVSLAHRHDPDEARMQTMLLALLMLLGSVNLLRILHDEPRETSRDRQGAEKAPLADARGSFNGDRLLRWVALLAPVVYVAVVYTPLLAWLFDLVPLSLADWGMVLAVGGVAVVLLLALDRLPRTLRVT